MKQRILLPILLFVAVIGTSCVSQHNVERNYSEFKPDQVRLYMTMDDYQYLGDVIVDVEYTTYLGIFRKIKTVNGEPYDPRFYHVTNIGFRGNINRKLGALKKALYKVTETYPNADYIMPASYNDVVEHMFAGRTHKRSMVVKVYAVNKISAEDAQKQHENELKAVEDQNTALQQQLSELRSELKNTKDELEKAQLDARINAQKNAKTRR
jgi:hypothetical protein